MHHAQGIISLFLASKILIPRGKGIPISIDGGANIPIVITPFKIVLEPKKVFIMNGIIIINMITVTARIAIILKMVDS